MRILQILFFPIVFITLLLLAVFSQGMYDPGDGVLHHLIARYAPEHPELFLHHWGKPLYTLLSSPFAHFGYNGTVAFNLLCMCTSAWLAWKTAARLKIPYAFFAAPFVLFAPIALPVAMSGLTEPLFALVLMLGVYLVVSGRFGIAAIVISFLPFARTEGFFLAPLFGLFFLLRRDFVSIALLAFGTLLYSTIGFFANGDFLWIIHENPYKGAEDIYGHGTLFHFIELNEFIWGWALDLLLLLSIFVYVFRKKFKAEISLAEYLLVPGIFLLFLILHSVFWWKGLFGSYGLHRVFACTIPLAAIAGLRGFQFLQRYVQHKNLLTGILILFLGLQIFLALRQHPLPFAASHQEKTIHEMADWMKKNQQDGKRIFSAHPFVAFATETDPYDTAHWQQFYCTCDEVKFRRGDLLIWDSHFAKFDLKFDLELLQQDPRFGELNHFGEMPKDHEDETRKFGVWVFEVK